MASHQPPRNALAGETSPYLLQHAGNPVDWRPWGADAIREARERDLPLFVSIGYSTCHWCHVMERESFVSEAVAARLNRDFVPVKVDREERPDVDEVYMAACQAFTRITEGRASGGWPLSAWVEPHGLRPFFVGTYFPPEARFGRPSFPTVLERLAAAWRERREEVDAQAERIAALVAADLAPEDAAAEAIDLPALAARTAAALVGFADFTHGGFGGAPKFPQPPFLRLVEAFGGERGREVARKALHAMLEGGIHDQVGGGFHRYAVDASWTVPHFEKMLYDQALLLPFLARAAAAGDAHAAFGAERLVGFLERELSEGDGCFRSALDAEADGREGDPYAWTDGAFRAAFAPDEAELAAEAAELYGLALGPNFRDPHHDDAPPMRVLRLAGPPSCAAEELARRERFDARLRAARDRRPQPAVDDKVIAAWNGLMVAGLAEAGRRLDREDWIARAERAFAATLARLGPVADLAAPGADPEIDRRLAGAFRAARSALVANPTGSAAFLAVAATHRIDLRSGAAADADEPVSIRFRAGPEAGRGTLEFALPDGVHVPLGDPPLAVACGGVAIEATPPAGLAELRGAASVSLRFPAAPSAAELEVTFATCRDFACRPARTVRVALA